MSTTVLEEDFQGIAGDKTLFARENLEKLERCTVVITGATGLVGSLLLRSLLYLNDTCALHLTVIPVIRNEEKLKTILGEIPAAVCPVMADVTERDFVKEAGEKIRKILEHTGSQEPGEQAQEDRKEEGSRAKECREEEEDRKFRRGNLYFFHCAAVTTSKTMVEKPVETIAASCDGTRNLLETARVLHADSFVYLSSMEVYGDMSVYGDGNTRATEDRLGVLDLLNVRTDYPESKRLCENLCCAYHAEYGVPVKIARLAQTFGARASLRATTATRRTACGGSSTFSLWVRTAPPTTSPTNPATRRSAGWQRWWQTRLQRGRFTLSMTSQRPTPSAMRQTPISFWTARSSGALAGHRRQTFRRCTGG